MMNSPMRLEEGRTGRPAAMQTNPRQYSSIMLYCTLEVGLMTRVTVKVTDETHEKLRWLCYKQRRSQQVIVEEILKRALAKVEVPKEGRRSKA